MSSVFYLPMTTHAHKISNTQHDVFLNLPRENLLADTQEVINSSRNNWFAWPTILSTRQKCTQDRSGWACQHPGQLVSHIILDWHWTVSSMSHEKQSPVFLILRTNIFRYFHYRRIFGRTENVNPDSWQTRKDFDLFVWQVLHLWFLPPFFCSL